ncbi:MAG: hypothetical protein RMJ66_02520 [Bacteroidia bacterium]|nr:hypothetical protein [Bacteroidia bacterium]MDW8133919.1 hypothetical protein [Bacteroidia bacterium]
MAARLIGLISLCLSQVIERRQGHPTLVTFAEFGSRRPVIWISLSWAHRPHQWEIGALVAYAAIWRGTVGGKKDFLESLADSIGLKLSIWSGPEGAALIGTVPRIYLLQAVEWLYDALSQVFYTSAPKWENCRRHFLRKWEGPSLQRELEWRLLANGVPPTHFSQNDIALYIERYLQPDSLYLIIGTNLSLREKIQIRKYLFRVPFSFSESTSPPSPSPSSPTDTTEENIWAYPAYVALKIATPLQLPERLAFIQAFIQKWHREAPPIQWRGFFWGDSVYFLQARLDGKSYRFLRNLSEIRPKDSTEIQVWQAAYKLARAYILTYPEKHPDIWIASILRRDSMELPETLATEVWKKGWSFRRQGIWLYNELLLMDTLPLLQPSIETKRDSIGRPTNLFWDGTNRPPLEEWAKVLKTFPLPSPESAWELIGYYRKPRQRERRLRELHAIRKTLIANYGVPPARLRVIIVKLEAQNLSQRALHLRCCVE